MEPGRLATSFSSPFVEAGLPISELYLDVLQDKLTTDKHGNQIPGQKQIKFLIYLKIIGRATEAESVGANFKSIRVSGYLVLPAFFPKEVVLPVTGEATLGERKGSLKIEGDLPELRINAAREVLGDRVVGFFYYT
ncbi:MAG: hypothetical protein F6J93_34430 [Oscillatoria sp. SIO1A7]|nr:hypothetical protein [Oscillatoria sp. SIO1A7]